MEKTLNLANKGSFRMQPAIYMVIKASSSNQNGHSFFVQVEQITFHIIKMLVYRKSDLG